MHFEEPDCPSIGKAIEAAHHLFEGFPDVTATLKLSTPALASFLVIQCPLLAAGLFPSEIVVMSCLAVHLEDVCAFRRLVEKPCLLPCFRTCEVRRHRSYTLEAGQVVHDRSHDQVSVSHLGDVRGRMYKDKSLKY